MKGVQLTKLVQELGLHNLTPEIDLSEIVIKTAEINRPALQLTGYLEHFANERVQIIGYVEYTYLMQLSDEERKFKYERFIFQQDSLCNFQYNDKTITGYDRSGS